MIKQHSDKKLFVNTVTPSQLTKLHAAAVLTWVDSWRRCPIYHDNISCMRSASNEWWALAEGSTSRTSSWLAGVSYTLNSTYGDKVKFKTLKNLCVYLTQHTRNSSSGAAVSGVRDTRETRWKVITKVTNDKWQKGDVISSTSSNIAIYDSWQTTV